MKKVYALLLSMLVVAFLTPCEKANAQYTCSSYSVIANSDAWSPISSNEITEAEPNSGDLCSTYYSKISNDITVPFSFRFCNIVTNKIKVEGISGNVICSGSDSWPDNVLYDIYGNYYFTCQSTQTNYGYSTRSE